MHLWVEQQSWVCGLHPWKTNQIFFSDKNDLFYSWLFVCPSGSPGVPVRILWQFQISTCNELYLPKWQCSLVGDVYLKLPLNLVVERLHWAASSPELNPIKHLCDQFEHADCCVVTNTTTVALLKYGMPWSVYDQNSEKEKVTGCCGCIWFFNTLRGPLFFKWINSQ